MSRHDELRQIVWDAILAGRCADTSCLETCADCATTAVLGKLTNPQPGRREIDVSVMGDADQQIHWQEYLTVEVHTGSGWCTRTRPQGARAGTGDGVKPRAQHQRARGFGVLR